MEDRAIPGHWEGDMPSQCGDDRRRVFAGDLYERGETRMAFLNMGSWAGDGQTQGLYRGHGCESLLL